MKPTGKISLTRFCFLLFVLVSYTDTFVLAAPKGGRVVSGTATIQQDGNLTTITAGNRSIINYGSFNIAAGETVRFVQPGANSTVLNRVVGSASPTEIFGTLQANGHVVLANPYGIFFQNGSVINVGGLIAGAGQLSDADFAKGKIHFTDLAGDVRNDGVIAADNRIALLGANVLNTGSLKAGTGMAMMVSGSDVYVGEKNGNIFVQANGKAAAAAKAATPNGGVSGSRGTVVNSGTVAAPRILIGGGDLYSTAISNSGLLQGRQVTVNAGRQGSATVGGSIDASSASNRTSTGKGGTIEVTGGTVALKGATLNASGAQGGGNVRVGGDFHGAGTLAHSQTTTVDSATTIKADATGVTGDGGNVVLWSDIGTVYAGQISANAGAKAGNGGQMEISSHGQLGFTGQVTANAPAGRVGSLLLDPDNIRIVATAPGANDAAFTAGGGTITADQGAGTEYQISQSALATLPGNLNIDLQATKDIHIDSLNGGTLTFMPPVVVGGVVTAGTITFNAGYNRTTGSFAMDPADTLVTNGRPLTINAAGIGSGGINSPATPALYPGGADPANFAILAGNLNTVPPAVLPVAPLTTPLNTIPTPAGTAGGSVQLVNRVATNGNTAPNFPVQVTSLTTGSSTGPAGGVTIGPMTAGNYPATSIGVTGALGASATGTGNSAGAGGAINLTSSGTITLGGPVNATSTGGAGGVLTLTNTGLLTLGGTVSGGSLTTGTGAVALNGSTVTTSLGGNTGGQVYNGPVTLGSAVGTTTLTANNAGPILFASTLNATGTTYQALGLATSGTQTFNGRVGDPANGGLLASLFTGTGPVNVNTTLVETTSTQSYQGPLTLGNNLQLVTTATSGTNAGNIDFLSTVGGAGFQLTTQTGQGDTFFGPDSGSPASAANVLGSLITSPNGRTVFRSTGFTTSGPQEYRNGVVTYRNTAGSSTFTLTSNNAGITFDSYLVSSSTALADVTMNAANGVVTFAGTVGGFLPVATPTAANPNAAALNSLTVTAQSVAINGGLVNTTNTAPLGNVQDGTQVYNAPVTLGKDTTLVASTVTLNPATNVIDAQGHDLTLTLSGLARVSNAYYVNVRSFISNGLGGSSITGNFNTTGFQHYENATSLDGPATLTAGPVANQDTIRFGPTLNSPGAYALTLTSTAPANTTDQIAFLGTVGDSAPLGSVVTTNGVTTTNVNGGLVHTTGLQTYAGPILLGATPVAPAAFGSTLFQSTNGGALTFSSAVDASPTPGTAPQALVTSTKGQLTLGGAVGGNQRLFELDAGGGGITVVSGGLVHTGGTIVGGMGQIYRGRVQISGAANTTFLDDTPAPSTSATNDLTFQSTLDNLVAGTPNLTLNTTGNVVLNDVVGSNGALGNFTVIAGFTTFFNGQTGDASVRSNGTQLYRYTDLTVPGQVVLQRSASFTSLQNANITFATDIDGTTNGGENLSVNTGGLTRFNGLIGRLVPLANLTTDNAGIANEQTQFNMALGQATQGVAVRGAVTINDPVLFNATPGGTGVPAPTVLSGVLNGPGSQTYLGAATVQQDTALQDGGTGSIGFGARVNNGTSTASNLYISSGGDEIFNGLVGNLAPLGGLQTDVVGTVGGTTRFNMDLSLAAAGGAGVDVTGDVFVHDSVLFNAPNNLVGGVQTVPTVRTSGAQTYQALPGTALTSTLAQNTILRSTGSGNIQFYGALDNQVATPARDLAIFTAGGTIFNAPVGGSQQPASLTTDQPGSTLLNGGFVGTGNFQDYGDPVYLGVDNTLNSGSVTFRQTVDTASPALYRTLTINTGTFIQFGDVVGGNGPLGALLANAGTETRILGNRIFTTRTGNDPSVAGYRSGTQTFNGRVTLENNLVTLQSGAAGTATHGGDITFNGLVDSDSIATSRGLTINTGGLTVFNALVGSLAPLASLTTDFENASGEQTRFVFDLNGAAQGVGLVGALTLADAVFFQVSGASAAQPTVLTGLLGGAGSQTYGPASLPSVLQGQLTSPVTLARDTFLVDQAGSGVSFLRGASINGTYNLTINTSGSISLGELVGSLNPLASLTLTTPTPNTPGTIYLSAGATQAAGQIITTGFQLYQKPIRLLSDQTLYSSNGNVVDFQSTIDNPFNLAVSTPGETRFGNQVGSASALASLTVADRNGYVLLDGGAVTTVNSQSYNELAYLGTNNVLTSQNGPVLFATTLDSATSAVPRDLLVRTGGLTYFGGSVGAGRDAANNLLALGSLTMDAGGSTQIGGGTLGPVTVNTVRGVVRPDGTATTGVQSYGDSVELGSNATLNSRVGGSAATGGEIAFENTVDGAFTLTLNTTGTTRFGNANTHAGGVVGSITPLAGLFTDNDPAIGVNGETQFNMAVGNARAGVTVNGPVQINDSAVFNTTGASTARPTILTRGTADAATQTYVGPVRLSTSTYLTSAALALAPDGSFTGGGAILFGDTASGVTSGVPGVGLSVRAGVGNLEFDRPVNVGSLDIGGANVTFRGPVTLPGLLSVLPNDNDLSGTIKLAFGAITTNGLQHYRVGVCLGADTVLTSLNTLGDGGSITFDGVVYSNPAAPAPYSLTVNTSGDEYFNGLVGSVANGQLANLTTDSDPNNRGGTAHFLMPLGLTPSGTAGVNVIGAVTINDQVEFGARGSSLADGSHPTILTGSAQTYNGAATLSADTALVSRNGGTLTFKSTVDGGYGLAVSSAGDEVFGGLVGRGTALVSLSTDVATVAGGQTRFDMDTQGSGPGVNIAGDVTVTDTVVFNAANVALNTPDRPTVLTGGNQTYQGPALLGAPTALTSRAGFLLLNNTVDGAYGLATNSTAYQEFHGLVGSAAAPLSLTTNGGDTRFTMTIPAAAPAGVRVNGPLMVNGTTLFAVAGVDTDHPSVLTLGNAAQAYNGAARLGAATLLRGGGNLLLAGTVDGAFALTLDAAGLTILNGPVGGGTALASLNTTKSGTLRLNAGSVTTVGLQTYRNPVTLASDARLTSTGGADLTFASTLNGGFNLFLDSTGNEIFNSRVGGVTPLASLTTDGRLGTPGGTTVLNVSGGVSILTSGAQTYNDGLTLQQAATLTSTGGPITAASVAGGGFNLNVNAAASTFGTIGNGGAVAFTIGGLAAFNGPINAGSLAVGAGTINLNAGTVTTSGSQSYLAGSVSLGQRTTVQAGGTVQFGPLLGNGYDLTLTSTGATFDTVTNAGALVWNVDGLALLNGDIAARSLLLNSGTAGSITLGGPGALRTVNTVGDQIFQGRVTLGLNTALTSTNSTVSVAALTGNSHDLTVTAVNSDFGRLADGGAVLFRVAGMTTLNDKVNAASLEVTGLTAINGGNDGEYTIFTSGAQSYDADVTLGKDTVLTSTGGTITSAQTFRGNEHSLTVNAPNAVFGKIDRTADTVFAVTGTTALNDTVDAGSLTVGPNGGTLNLNAGTVTTDRFQTYQETVLLKTGTTLASRNLDNDGGVTFDGTLDGAQTLLVDTANTTTFGGAVGQGEALASLTIQSGTAQVNGGIVNTTGNQLYQGQVRTNNVDGTSFNAALADMRFLQVVTGERGSLTAQAHRVRFNDSVSSDGDLRLTANLRPNDANTSLLLLGGTSYESRNGKVYLNAFDRRAQDGAQSAFSNVVFTGKDVNVSGLGFETGYLQKIFAAGSLTIDARGRQAIVGDLAAADNLTVRAGSILLLNRPKLTDYPERGANSGLNFVAGSRIDFGQATPVTYKYQGDQVANFVTRNGDVTILRAKGFSIFSDTTVNAQFRPGPKFAADGFLQRQGDNFNFANPFEPVSGGVVSLDTAAAIAGALPDQKPLDFPVEVNITAGQRDELDQLGIRSRPSVKRERGGTSARRALFAQLVDDDDPDNYGRLQPVKGGISRLKPSDYVVVVDRMSEREVRSVLQSFEDLYGKKREKAPEISNAYQTAYNDYLTENPTGETAGFGKYLVSKPGKYPAVDTAVRKYDGLFGYVEHMGLTSAEVAKAENRIVQTMAQNLQGPTADDMVKVINEQRKALPPGQKAPSSKLPPAPPASAPAPAASPAPEATKKPLQADRQDESPSVPAAPIHRGDLARL